MTADRSKSGTALLALTGLAFGTAFVTSMRAVPLLYVIIGCEILTRSWRSIPLRLATVALGSFLPVALSEAFFHFLLVVSGYAGILLCRQTFALDLGWHMLRYNVGIVRLAGYRISVGQYPYYLFVLENPVFLALAVVGIVLLVRACWRSVRVTTARLGGPGPGRDEPGPGSPEVVLLLGLLGLLLYWELAVDFKTLRYGSTLLPVLAMVGARGCLLVDRGLCRRFASAPARCAVTVLLVGVVLLAGGPTARGVAATQVGYRDVVNHLRSLGSPRLVATQPNVFRAVFGVEHVAIADNMRELRERHTAGFRYYVGCYQKYHHSWRDDMREVERYLASRSLPVEFPNAFGASVLAWWEGANMDPPKEWVKDAGRIRVWDLDEVFGTPTAPSSGSSSSPKEP